MSVLFTTERLTVRKFAAEDFEDLSEILTDKDVTYFEPYETFTKEACVQEALNFSKASSFLRSFPKIRSSEKFIFPQRISEAMK